MYNLYLQIIIVTLYGIFLTQVRACREIKSPFILSCIIRCMQTESQIGFSGWCGSSLHQANQISVQTCQTGFSTYRLPEYSLRRMTGSYGTMIIPLKNMIWAFACLHIHPKYSLNQHIYGDLMLISEQHRSSNTLQSWFTAALILTANQLRLLLGTLFSLS